MKVQSSLLLVLLVVSLPLNSLSVVLPEQWTKYLTDLLERLQNPLPAIVDPSSTQHMLLRSEIPSDPSTILMPRVIIWNPLTQFPLMRLSLEKCTQEHCDGDLKFYTWANGERKGMQPCLIHDTRSTVILVGAIYKCSNDHTVYSTDASILQKFNRTHIPFILLHRTGFIREFVQCVVNLAQEGLSMQSIQRHIEAIRNDFVVDVIQRLISDCNVYSSEQLTTSQIQSITSSTFVNMMSNPIPSNDIISRCFVITFEENELFYTNKMLQVKVKNCLRLDHTFKVASNVGYLRSDGKWITQYSSVFIVLNHKREVVTWQLTNSTSIDEVLDILSKLRERIQEGQQITFYVDNCCQVRKKLQQIFGTGILVKLDVFHAVQRITRAMSKKHTFYYQCIKDLRMVFRYPVDIGIKRTMETPEPSHMLHNLDSFVAKWQNVKCNSQSILTEKVMKQVMSLRTHIECGCLSNIEPSGGTNYNEALHRHINPHFSHAGRMGLHLAFVLLTVLFYNHNCKKSNSLNSLPKLVASKFAHTSTTKTGPFGIIRKSAHSSTACDPSVPSNSSLTVTDKSLIITEQQKDTMIRNAISLTQLADYTKQLVGNSQLFSYHMMPFMTYVPSLQLHCSHSSEHSEEQQHCQHLSNILTACSMCRHITAGDGNCCFSSVCFSLTSNLSKLDDCHKLFLHKKGLQAGMGISDMATHLRQLAVKEWMNNSHRYEPFLNHISIEDEAIKFLDSSHYQGDLGHTVLMCLANVLETPIIVFSSMAYHPIFCVTPEVQRVPLPLMVAYNQYGEGHFDGVVPVESVVSTEVNTVSCSCGKNDKSEKNHCCEIKYKYTSRVNCACLKNGSGCSKKCTCRNCVNVLGTKSNAPVTKRHS